MGYFARGRMLSRCGKASVGERGKAGMRIWPAALIVPCLFGVADPASAILYPFPSQVPPTSVRQRSFLPVPPAVVAPLPRTAGPEPQAAPAPHPDALSLADQVGQMLLVSVRSPSRRDFAAVMQECRPGGYVFFRSDLPGEAAARRTALALREWGRRSRAGIHPFLATDGEGGPVLRFPHQTQHPRDFPSASRLGRQRDPAAVRTAARHAAQALRRMGLNMNFAPVLDLGVSRSTVLRGRTFGAAPEQVAALGGAYIQALQQHGIIATAKHFPGHGCTPADSHRLLPTARLPYREWQRHLQPFRVAVRDARLDAVMVGHFRIRFSDAAAQRVGEAPASRSPYFLQQVLRRELGFTGIAITDDLSMAGFAARPAERDARIIEAVRSGADMLLLGTAFQPADVRRISRRLLQAAQRDPHLRRRIAESATRILEVKRRWKLAPANGVG